MSVPQHGVDVQDALASLCRWQVASSTHDTERFKAALTHPSAAEHLARMANAHVVVPALAAPLKALFDATSSNATLSELQIYCDVMAAENAKRNEYLAVQLSTCVASLNGAGIPNVVLKGGTYLTEPAPTNSAREWRFMTDLDLLVSEAKLKMAVAAIEGLGFVAVDQDYEPDRMAHYPPLISPCGRFSVELHTRLFARCRNVIPAEDIFANASRRSIGAVAVDIPEGAHRLVHLIAHAQLHNRFYALKRFTMRDVMDLAVLLNVTANSKALLAQAAKAFDDSATEQKAFEAFLTLSCRLLPEFETLELYRSTKAEAWVNSVLRRAGWPVWRHRLATFTDLAIHETQRTLFQRDARHRWLGLLQNPSRIPTWMADEAARLRAMR